MKPSDCLESDGLNGGSLASLPAPRLSDSVIVKRGQNAKRSGDSGMQGCRGQEAMLRDALIRLLSCEAMGRVMICTVRRLAGAFFR